MPAVAYKGGGEERGGNRTVVLLLALIGVVVLIVAGVMLRQRMRISGYVSALDSDDVDVRLNAYNGLLALGGKAMPAVRKALQEKKGAGLGCAASLAGELKDAAAAPRLVELLSDADEKVRRSATKGLGFLGAKEGVGPLTGCLDDSSAAVKGNAVWALGRIGEDAKPAAPKLIKIMSSSKEPMELRAACARALGRLGDPSAVEPLLSVLKPDHFDLASAAALALGDLRVKSAVQPLCVFLSRGITRPTDVEGLSGEVPTTEDVPPEIRVRAIQALQKIGDKGALPALKRLADPKVTISYRVRQAAEEALKELGG